jgi:hypothetical protein
MCKIADSFPHEEYERVLTESLEHHKCRLLLLKCPNGSKLARLESKFGCHVQG